MQEIIWVFGISAAGKKTFLKKVDENSFSEEELKEIHLPEKCKISKESLKTRKKRNQKKIKEEIRDTLLEGFSPVLKYQEIDFESEGQNIVSEVKNEFIDLKHRIIMLFIGYEQKKERWERINRESNWGHEPSRDKWISHSRILLNRVNEFSKEGFDVEYIDSSNRYSIITYEKAIELIGG